MKSKSIFQAAGQWLSSSPDRALEQAYQAALTIKAIEDEHFRGQKVASEFCDYSDSVVSYFKIEVNQNLTIARNKLSQFRTLRSLPISLPGQGAAEPYHGDRTVGILDKLSFIDRVIAKYDLPAPPAPEPVSSELSATQMGDRNGTHPVRPSKIPPAPALGKPNPQYETVSDKTGVLPRSFLRTLNRIKREIDPNSAETEEEVLLKFRNSRNKTTISVKFFLILIIVPLLTHQITKSFFIAPLVETWFANHEQVLFINQDFEEETLVELQRYQERLHLESLIGLTPEPQPEEIAEKLREKAAESIVEVRRREANAIANIFADICSLIAFTAIIAMSRKEIVVVKSFIDEIVYGLSDSAKAFLIILVTDIFVGYHSPHGWEVILEGIGQHFGLPENREFNFLFIATFPVILDTVLKYWIFRYLNRISPSSVATYRNMNE
ncbi:MAG: proton extrusion protein PcxA [Chloroflexaceae bacterium]|nr:proton extrusion protein PcxA [Chloroflexaceae bacterium]